MTLLPELELGVLNGWVLLLGYGAGFLVALAAFSKDERARLFADPKMQLHGIKKLMLRIGQLAAITFIVIMIFTPITSATGPLIVGVGLYVLGCATVLMALRYFKRATENQPVTEGPYRLSRNPQWVGLFLVLLGAAVMSGAWLMIVMVLVVALIYHLQILEEEKACSVLYGEPYLRYLRQTPRYFYWF